MKQTFNYPKTLRTYDENSFKVKYMTSHLSNTRSQKSISTSVHKPKRVIQQQTHNIDEYCILTNPSQFKGKQNKKKTKSKANKNQSHFSMALKHELQKPLVSQSKIGTQNIVHCKSLQRLQIISNDRSEQIKVLMAQKGRLYAQNEQLKTKLTNPTFREQQYIQKIAFKQYELQNLRQNLKRKEEKLNQIEKQYYSQIERLKRKHLQEVSRLKDEIGKLKLNQRYQSTTLRHNYSQQKGLSNAEKNQAHIRYPAQQTYTEKLMHPNQNTYTSQIAYGNNITPKGGLVYNQNKGTYRTDENKIDTKKYDQTQKTIHSTIHSKYFADPISAKDSSSARNYSPPKIIETVKPIHQQQKQNFRTYKGQDGYQRRVYYAQSEANTNQTNKVSGNAHIANGITRINQVSTTGSTHIQSGNSNYIRTDDAPVMRYSDLNTPFTNEKITTQFTQQPAYKYSSAYRYEANEANRNKNQSSAGYPVQNLYGNSLTFQCFPAQN